MIASFLALAAALTLHTQHPCRAPLPRGPAVPAPIVLHTSCGWFELARNGRITRLPNHWGAKHGVGTGRRYGAHLDLCCDRTGHVSIRLRGRLVWRSRFVHRGYAAAIAFGPNEFAFADYYRGVYLTDLRHPERLVVRGRGLFPYDFTRRGDLIVAGGRALQFFAPSGRRVGTYRFRLRNSFAFDWQTDRLLFVSPGGRLASVRDRRLRLGRSVQGFGGGLAVPAPGLVTLSRVGRIAVARPDGTIVASAGWNPARQAFNSRIGLTTDGRSFVFELTRVRPHASWGHAIVYVLRSGERRAHVLFDRWRAPIVCREGECGSGTGFDRNGRFFIYGPGDGHLALLDSRSGRAVDLTRLDRSLPHLGSRPEQATIAWKLDFPR